MPHTNFQKTNINECYHYGEYFLFHVVTNLCDSCHEKGKMGPNHALYRRDNYLHESTVEECGG